VPTSRFCWQAGWPEVGPCSAGSGLEVILRASHNPGLELGEPPGTWGCGGGGVSEQEDGARQTRSPEACLAQRQGRSLSH
jgi:hypothetical protein